MHLVQLLLPLYDNAGARQPEALFRDVRRELTEQFGGLTTYSRAPARGLWQDDANGATEQDEIVVYEVMVERIDAAWWREYRESLERAFRQKALVVRAQEIWVL
jgi:hypothetical protein